MVSEEEREMRLGPVEPLPQTKTLWSMRGLKSLSDEGDVMVVSVRYLS